MIIFILVLQIPPKKLNALQASRMYNPIFAHHSLGTFSILDIVIIRIIFSFIFQLIVFLFVLQWQRLQRVHHKEINKFLCNCKTKVEQVIPSSNKLHY